MQYLEELMQRYPELSSEKKHIQQAYETLRTCFQGGNKLLVAGNGGSAADADHIVGELMKGFVLPRRVNDEVKTNLLKAGDDGYIGRNLQGALPAISLGNHAALISAYSNDEAADLAFAQQVYGYGKAGDVFLGISTSGNSANILHAVKVARAKGLITIGLTGASGGQLFELADIVMTVPETETYKIQERHLPIYHVLCLMLEEEFFHG